MSQVFEALRKSAAERFGTEEETALAATELLLRTERGSAAQEKGDADAACIFDQQLKGEFPLPAFPHEVAAAGIAPKFDQRLQDEFALPAFLDEVAAGSTASEPFSIAGPAPDIASAAVFGNFESINISTSAGSRLASLVDRDSPAAEAFRLLAVRLRHLRRQKPLKKVLITSTVPGEGKSFASANLACSLALNLQQKILLIEGDVRHPTLWQIFGTAKMPGLCEHLRDGRSLSSCIYRLNDAGVWFFPAGSAQGDPLEIIQSVNLSVAMEQLAQWFDWIIVDSPPALPMADTTALARLADGIILVARRGVTRKQKLQKGLEALEPQKLIGALLNSSDGASDSDYYYYQHDSASPRNLANSK